MVVPQRSHVQRSPAGSDFTELLLEVFRLNGALIAAGNALCEGTGLTSSRWQVLGAIAAAERAVTAAQIARQMGLTRQTVQRLVDELESAGLVTRAADPEHGRARLVEFTAAGRRVYSTMQQRQAPWANEMAAGLSRKELGATAEVLRELRKRLEMNLNPAKEESS